MWQRHPCPETIEEAIAIQEHLRPLVITENQLETVRYVAGVDVGYNSSDSVSLAAVTVLSFPDLQLQQQSVVRSPTAFPSGQWAAIARGGIDFRCSAQDANRDQTDLCIDRS